MTTVSKDGCVEFRFFRRDVSDVRVVGDFAASGERRHPSAGSAGPLEFAMTGGPDGWWHATMALDAGEYRFRYLADGAWFTDYASNGIEVSKAVVNSVLVVPERIARAAQSAAAKMVA